jgi:undecaprenyl diphosphate synthase
MDPSSRAQHTTGHSADKLIMSEKNIPECIGIIMDGNRRWAKQKGLLSLEGHKKGYETLKDCLKWAKEKGIKYVIAYTFSVENWNRSKEEVSYLINLLSDGITNELNSLREENVKFKMIGKREMFSEPLQEGIKKLEEDTKDASGPTFIAALSYGGRLEIIEATNRAIEKGKKVDEESFKDLLWTVEIPDPDLIIRTGGEKRFSGFLPWQSVYSELFFMDTFWPDFSKEEFNKILDDYSQIERRNGK